MFKSRLIIAMVAIASLGGVAAADGYEPAGKAMAAPVADYAWGGFYVGVGVGAAQFDNSVKTKGEKEKVHEHCYGRSWDCKKDSDGWYESYSKTIYGKASSSDDAWNVFGTAQVGYDHLMGNKFLIGVFADFDFFPQSDSSITTTLAHYDCDECYEDGVGYMKGNLNLEHIWNIGGRIGFLVSPRWLIYGAGGYSEASIGGSADVHFWRAPSVKMDLDDDLQGWFLEGGAEVKVHRNVSFKFGYRYQQFDDSHLSGSAHHVGYKKWGHCGGKCWGRDVKWVDADMDIETEIHSVRAALVISLTPEERPVVPLK